MAERDTYHLRRVGPTTCKPGVTDVMDFERIANMIGRNPSMVEYVIDSCDDAKSMCISDLHARVVLKPGNQHRLYDDSFSGVFVNDVKIEGSCILQEGDRVTFGHPELNIPPGEKVLQPDSEYQFIFERCNCPRHATADTEKSEFPSAEELNRGSDTKEAQNEQVDDKQNEDRSKDKHINPECDHSSFCGLTRAECQEPDVYDDCRVSGLHTDLHFEQTEGSLILDNCIRNVRYQDNSGETASSGDRDCITDMININNTVTNVCSPGANKYVYSESAINAESIPSKFGECEAFQLELQNGSEMAKNERYSAHLTHNLENVWLSSEVHHLEISDTNELELSFIDLDEIDSGSHSSSFNDLIQLNGTSSHKHCQTEARPEKKIKDTELSTNLLIQRDMCEESRQCSSGNAKQLDVLCDNRPEECYTCPIEMGSDIINGVADSVTSAEHSSTEKDSNTKQFASQSNLEEFDKVDLEISDFSFKTEMPCQTIRNKDCQEIADTKHLNLVNHEAKCVMIHGEDSVEKSGRKPNLPGRNIHKENRLDTCIQKICTDMTQEQAGQSHEDLMRNKFDKRSLDHADELKSVLLQFFIFRKKYEAIKDVSKAKVKRQNIEKIAKRFFKHSQPNQISTYSKTKNECLLAKAISKTSLVNENGNTSINKAVSVTVSDPDKVNVSDCDNMNVTVSSSYMVSPTDCHYATNEHAANKENFFSVSENNKQPSHEPSEEGNSVEKKDDTDNINYVEETDKENNKHSELPTHRKVLVNVDTDTKTNNTADNDDGGGDKTPERHSIDSKKDGNERSSDSYLLKDSKILLACSRSYPISEDELKKSPVSTRDNKSDAKTIPTEQIMQEISCTFSDSDDDDNDIVSPTVDVSHLDETSNSLQSSQEEKTHDNHTDNENENTILKTVNNSNQTEHTNEVLCLNKDEEMVSDSASEGNSEVLQSQTESLWLNLSFTKPLTEVGTCTNKSDNSVGQNDEREYSQDIEAGVEHPNEKLLMKGNIDNKYPDTDMNKRPLSCSQHSDLDDNSMSETLLLDGQIDERPKTYTKDSKSQDKTRLKVEYQKQSTSGEQNGDRWISSQDEHCKMKNGKSEGKGVRLKEYQIIHRAKKVIADLMSAFQTTSLSSSSRIQALRQELASIEKKANIPRTVIAVVGDTGAGKSSLMNALLDHRSVLPTSGIRACTAVAVEVEDNADNDTFEADIDFLSEEEWHQELHHLMNDLTDLQGKFRKGPPNSESDTYVSYLKVKAVYGKVDTMENLTQITDITQYLGQTKQVRSQHSEDFRKQVEQFISQPKKADVGRQYWPVIKLVHLRLPNCYVCSSGAVLVDLPGLGDVNQAREMVAKEYLKNCAAVWIVSDIIRAIDCKTAKTLLGETFRRQLLMDGQYGNIAFICSKSDILEPSEIISDLRLEKHTQVTEERLTSIENEKSRLEKEIRSYQEDVCSVSHEIKQEEENIFIKELYNEMTSTATQIEVAERKTDKTKKRIEDCKTLINKLDRELTGYRKELSTICARARNKNASEQIKKDFKAGLKDMKRQADQNSEEYDDYGDDDDEEDDKDTCSSADDLRVFCCSATEYQKMKNLLTDDGPPKVFSSIEDTEIPLLRDYVHEITSERNTQEVERFVDSLGRFVFDHKLQSYVAEHTPEVGIFGLLVMKLLTKINRYEREE